MIWDHVTWRWWRDGDNHWIHGLLPWFTLGPGRGLHPAVVRDEATDLDVYYVYRIKSNKISLSLSFPLSLCVGLSLTICLFLFRCVCVSLSVSLFVGLFVNVFLPRIPPEATKECSLMVDSRSSSFVTNYSRVGGSPRTQSKPGQESVNSVIVTMPPSTSRHVIP